LYRRASDGIDGRRRKTRSGERAKFELCLEDALSLLSAGDQDAARCVTGEKEKDVRLGMPSDVLDSELLRIAGEFLSGSYVA
jgi:hypothetical protein